MINIRRSEQRGLADHGWLKSRHTFSFAEYYDPKYMNFGPLRVINEDRIKGGSGFGQHPHRDMEIISYVIEGALEHQDSMGNKAVIRPGEIQRMSAGTGVVHAEYNASPDQTTHFLQIWVMPNALNLQPSYGQKSFAEELEKKNLVLVLSQSGRDGSLPIHQDANIYLSRLKAGDSLMFPADSGRGFWLQVIKGALNVEGENVMAGDAVSLTHVPTFTLVATQNAECLLFDLPVGDFR